MPTTNVSLTTDWTPIAYGPSVGAGSISGHVNPIEIFIGTSVPSADEDGFKSYQSDPFLFDLVFGETLYARASSNTGLAKAIVNKNEQTILFSNQESSFNTTTVKIESPSGTSLIIQWGDGSSTMATGIGSLVTYTHDYTIADTYPISLSGEFENVNDLQVTSQSWIEGDIYNCSFLTGLDTLRLSATSMTGDIAHAANLPSLFDLRVDTTAISGNLSSLSENEIFRYLYFYNTNIVGDIVHLALMVDILELRLYNTSIEGTLSSIANLTSIRILQLQNTQIVGDIMYLSGMTLANTLFVFDTAISGALSGVSTLTSMGNFRAYNSNVSGDIASLATWSVATFIYLFNSSVDTYTSTTLPAWSGSTIRVESLSLSSTEVDNFLIDLNTAGGTGGTLNIAGTNAARTSASDAAYTSLLGKSWTITVN